MSSDAVPDEGQGNISFRQIECFRHVMLLQSAVAASQAMRISQPSVSRAILKLEQEVGFLLFTRDGNRMRPTEDAARLYQVVARTIDGLTEIGRTAAAIRSQRLGRLRIIALPVFLDTLVTAALGEFALRHPDLRFELEAGGMVRVMTEVGTGRFELGIGSSPGDHPAVRSVLLERRPTVAVAPASLALGTSGVVSWRELARQRFVGLLPQSPFRRIVDAQFERLGVQPEMVVEGCTQAAVLQLVRAGIGVSVLDGRAVPRDDPALQVLQLDEPASWDCHMILPRHELPGHALRGFMQFLRERAAAGAPPGEPQPGSGSAVL